MDEKVKCDVVPELRGFIEAAVDYHNSNNEGSWYCSSVISSSDSGKNIKTVNIALCMGESK